MRFAGVYADRLREEPWVSAPTIAVGAWVKLVVRASELEVETIPLKRGASRAWIVTANVSTSDINSAITAGLAEWRDNGLFVLGFDHDGLQNVERKRENGRLGGRPKTNRLPTGYIRVNRRQTETEPLSSPLLSSPLLTNMNSAETGKAGSSHGGEVPSAGPHEPSDADPVVLVFPCDGSTRTWELRQSQVDRWRELYPSLDIEACCRSALAWVDASPSRRKTARGMTRYLVGWLNRKQDRGDQQVPASFAAACGWHAGGRNRERPSRYPREDCPECRHAKAFTARRKSEPEPVARTLDIQGFDDTSWQQAWAQQFPDEAWPGRKDGIARLMNRGEELPAWAGGPA